MMGIMMVHVALLLVTSVSNETKKETMINMNQPGRLPNTVSWSPIHCESPDS